MNESPNLSDVELKISRKHRHNGALRCAQHDDFCLVMMLDTLSRGSHPRCENLRVRYDLVRNIVRT